MPTEKQNNLWNLVQAMAKAPKKQKQKAVKKFKQSAEEEKAIAALHKAVLEMQRWKPVALVQIIYQTQCSCGSVHLIPEHYSQTPKPLVRFINNQTGDIWEKRTEVTNLGKLPKVTRILKSHSTCCPDCFYSDAAETLIVHKFPK